MTFQSKALWFGGADLLVLSSGTGGEIADPHNVTNLLFGQSDKSWIL